MRLLADMGVSHSTVRWLLSSGHDCVHARDLGLGRADDAAILERASTESRTVLTFDLDFGAILALGGQAQPSVVIFRLDDARPDNVNCRLAETLSAGDQALRAGAVIICEQKRCRVRRLPIRVAGRP